jgi:uncharacterized membrane protein
VHVRDLAAGAAHDGTTLPQRYHQLFRVWSWLGWPAFLGVIAIFALMIWKPVLPHPYGLNFSLDESFAAEKSPRT